MKRAHGFIFIHSQQLIWAVYEGEKLAIAVACLHLFDEQNMGEFRHMIARMLIDEKGLSVPAAATFACLPVKHRPAAA
jgi:hypothetical protein